MTPTDAQRKAAFINGTAEAHRHLAAVMQKHGGDLTLAYANGLLSGLAEWLLARREFREVYGTFQEIADNIVAAHLKEKK